MLVFKLSSSSLHSLCVPRPSHMVFVHIWCPEVAASKCRWIHPERTLWQKQIFSQTEDAANVSRRDELNFGLIGGCGWCNGLTSKFHTSFIEVDQPTTTWRSILPLCVDQWPDVLMWRRSGQKWDYEEKFSVLWVYTMIGN